MSYWTDDLLAEKLKNKDLSVEVPNIAPGRKSDSSSAGEGSLSLEGKFRVNSRRVNKYGVAPRDERTYNGVVYHSKKEALFAADLEMRKKAGDIDFWLRQVPFRLPGKTVYRLDFMTFKKIEQPMKGEPLNFIFPMFLVEYIEVKGRAIPLGEIKRRQTEELYGIRIRVV